MALSKLSLIKMLRPGMGQLGTHAPKELSLPVKKNRKGNVSYFPKISIIVPSLNQGHFIEETLKSILTESYPNLELIVIDGGSMDRSVAIIKSFEPHLAWWVSEPDNGQAAAINKGFRKATGDILAWINADDLVAPNALYSVAHHFQNHPDIQVLYGNRILIDENSQEIGRWILPAHSEKLLKWSDYVPQETLYWRRSAWLAVGGQLDESYHFAMDWDLLLRFSAQHLKIEHLPYFLGLFRIHSKQKTHKQLSSVGYVEMQKLRCRELGFAPTRWQRLVHTAPYFLSAKLQDLCYRLNRSRYMDA